MTKSYNHSTMRTPYFKSRIWVNAYHTQKITSHFMSNILIALQLNQYGKGKNSWTGLLNQPLYILSFLKIIIAFKVFLGNYCQKLPLKNSTKSSCLLWCSFTIQYANVRGRYIEIINKHSEMLMKLKPMYSFGK